MKKARLLIATLVCAVMLMGVGYAWWNDTVTIGGTASTGDMNVIFTETLATAVGDAVGYVGATATVKNDNKEIECTFTDLYPGAEVEFSATVKNESSMPVRFDGATFELDGIDEEYKQYVQVKPTTLLGIPMTGLDWVTIDAFVKAMNQYCKSLSIAPESAPEFAIALRLAEGAPDELKKQTIKLSVQFDWRQFNAPASEL